MRTPFSPRLAPVISILAVAGCEFLVIPNVPHRLGVPYVAQIRGGFCGPACVLMWRKYQLGGPHPTQGEIAATVGRPNGWLSEDQIRDAVRFYTLSNDAIYDFEAAQNKRDIYARQISAVDDGDTLIAIVDDEHHAVALDGCLYVRGPVYRTWETVYYNDPDSLFRQQTRNAADWDTYFCTRFVCKQIVSDWATRNWHENQSTYGPPTLRVRGLRGCPHCPPQP